MKIELLTIESRILYFLAVLHTITHDQIYELLNDFDKNDVKIAMETLKKLDYLYIKEYEIPALDQGIITKKSEKISVITYALNFKSRPIIFKKHFELQFYRRNNPRGNRWRKRIYHDLLIVEALIYISKKLQIKDIYNEEYLQRMRQNMADLRVEVVNSEGNTALIDLEVVVTNTKKQIENKPDHFIFFTYSRYQADIINEIKNTKAVVLTVSGDEILDKYEPVDVEDSDKFEEVLDKLTHSGGAFTAPAFSKLMNLEIREASKMLHQMEKCGLLFADYLHLTPSNRGPRNKIYSVNRSLIKDHSDRIMNLMCSKLAENTHDKLTFMGMNRDRRVAVFYLNNSQRYEFYLDNIGKSLTNNYYVFQNLIKNEIEKDTKFFYQFASIDRRNEYNYIKNLVE